MKLIKSIFFILFMLNSYIFCQPSVDWVARYNSPYDLSDYPWNMAVSSSGNIYVTGASNYIGSGAQFVTIKYNSSGSHVWTAVYGTGSNLNGGWALALDGDENIYVVGYGNEPGNGNDDYITLKYNSSGTQQWVTTYNGTGNSDDVALGITLDNNGGVYITGQSIGSSTGIDFVTIKYNTSNGSQSWVDRYAGTGSNYDFPTGFITPITTDVAGNIYVTGVTQSSNYNFVTIKYLSNGTRSWVNTYNGAGNGFDVSNAIATYNDGFSFSSNIYVTGISQTKNSVNAITTIAYDDQGNQLWVNVFDESNDKTDGAGNSIVIDGSGNIIVAGAYTPDWTSHDLDIKTIKYDSDGDELWNADYNGTNNNLDYGRFVTCDVNGNVYVTGESKSSSSNGSEDFATIKYNSGGTQQWAVLYNGPGQSYDYPRQVFVPTSDLSTPYVLVMGRSRGSSVNYDYTIIKYNQSTLDNTATNNNNQLKSYNYPNPFNPQTNIFFQNLNSGNVKIIIYNYLGQEIQTVKNDYLQKGIYSVTWDGSKYSSGIYFYNIITSEYTETRKMMLIK